VLNDHLANDDYNATMHYVTLQHADSGAKISKKKSKEDWIEA